MRRLRRPRWKHQRRRTAGRRAGLAALLVGVKHHAQAPSEDGQDAGNAGSQIIGDASTFSCSCPEVRVGVRVLQRVQPAWTATMGTISGGRPRCGQLDRSVRANATGPGSEREAAAGRAAKLRVCPRAASDTHRQHALCRPAVSDVVGRDDCRSYRRPERRCGRGTIGFRSRPEASDSNAQGF